MSYTYINEDQIDPELKCMICLEPFQSPVNCINCGQTFCQQCIDTWNKEQLSCPSCRENGYLFVPVVTRIVLNQLNRLLVQCALCQKTDIERIHFSDHMALTCPKQTVMCMDKCKWKGRRENLEKHLIRCRKKSLYCFKWRNLFSCISQV